MENVKKTALVSVTTVLKEKIVEIDHVQKLTKTLATALPVVVMGLAIRRSVPVSARPAIVLWELTLHHIKGCVVRSSAPTVAMGMESAISPLENVLANLDLEKIAQVRK